MARIAYSDFDILIQRAAEGYRAQVLTSPAGQAVTTFSLPFSDLEVENFLLRIGRPRRGTRRVDSPEVGAAKAFGERLFTAVFNGDVRGCLRSSLDDVVRRDAGLRIRLRLTDVPELADLPWEYLYNPSLNRFLALSVETPFVRYLDLPESIRPFTVTPPLRVLVMISSPRDYPKLDVEKEWAKLQQSVADLTKGGLIVLERLDGATLSVLQRRLRREDYHMFHFIGHGGFEQKLQDGVLIFEDDAERGRSVSGQDLGTLLHDHRALRLVVLNACEGARTSRTDPFAGTAQSLVQQGLPAVIAMQFEITDEAAITFAHEFYAAVADGYPVDAAVAEARKAIFADGNGLEWGTPVLYLRAADGLVFNVERIETGKAEVLPPKVEPEKRPEPEHLAAKPVPRADLRAKDEPRARTEQTGGDGRLKKTWVVTAALLAVVLIGVIVWFREAPRPNPVVSLAVLAERRNIAIEERSALKLRVAYSDGSTKEITEGVEWRSSNPTVGSVNASGQFEAFKGGTTEITARFGGVASSPLILSIKAPDIPKPPQLVSLRVEAGKNELKAEERLNLKLLAKYSDGTEKVVAKGVKWRSSQPTVVAVSSTGDALTRNEGRAEITAVFEGVSSSPISLTVKGTEKPEPPPIRLVSLTVASQTQELAIGQRLRLAARGRYSDGAEKALSKAVEWRSSQPQVLVVSSDGLAEGRSEGRAEITANYEGLFSSPVALVVKKTAESQAAEIQARDKAIKGYLASAASYRERGEYAGALAILEKARAVDPKNKEIEAAITTTTRACNAERRLGRADLKC